MFGAELEADSTATVDVRSMVDVKKVHGPRCFVDPEHDSIGTAASAVAPSQRPE